MKKLYATIALALMAIAASAQEADNTVTVTLDFNQNPWNYSVRQSTNKDEWGGTGRTPKGTEDYWDYDGTLLDDKDFSWPMPESSGTSEKIKVTLYAVDLDEYNTVSVYGNYSLGSRLSVCRGGLQEYLVHPCWNHNALRITKGL